MLLVVGQIGRPHGIRGEVTVDVRTDEPAQRFAPGTVLQTDPGNANVERPAGAWRVPPKLVVDVARPHLGRLIVAFEGIDDRNLAEDLRGVLLCVDSADLPTPDDPDEFNDHQLVGLAAQSPEGERLGEVIRVDHAPAADLLVLRRPDGRTALVPFVKAIVTDVDLDAGRVVVAPPEGLLDL
jgi:16S rRNA processing protein RimM